MVKQLKRWRVTVYLNGSCLKDEVIETVFDYPHFSVGMPFVGGSQDARYPDEIHVVVHRMKDGE